MRFLLLRLWCARLGLLYYYVYKQAYDWSIMRFCCFYRLVLFWLILIAWFDLYECCFLIFFSEFWTAMKNVFLCDLWLWLVMDSMYYFSFSAFLIMLLNFAVTTGRRLWCWISCSASWTGWGSQWWCCWHFRSGKRGWWRGGGSWRWGWRRCSGGVASCLFTPQEEEGQWWWRWRGGWRWSSTDKAIQEAPLTTHHYKLYHVLVLWWLSMYWKQRNLSLDIEQWLVFRNLAVGQRTY